MLGRRILLSSAAAFLRAAAAFILLLAAARLLSLIDFGHFMYVYTVVAVSGVIFDYGQQLSLLRNVSLQPDRERELLTRAIAGKFVLAVPFIASYGVALAVDASLRGSITIGIVLLIGYAASSLSIVLMVPERARSNLVPDVVVSAIDVTTLAASLALVSMGRAEPLGMSLAFCASKLAACAASWFFARRPLPNWSSMRHWVIELWEGVPYAAHLAVGMLFVNVDLIVIKEMVSDSQYAIYQAGARLVQGIGFALTVINNVFLPRWARPQPPSKPHELRTVLLAGAIALIVVPFGVDQIAGPLVRLLYGDRYADLAPLMWVFTGIIVIRVVGAFVGVLMTLSGRQAQRVALGFAAVGSIVVLNYVLARDYGIRATALILLAVHVSHLCGAMFFERKRVGLNYSDK